MTRRSAAVSVVRGRVAPVSPPPNPQEPLPPPVKRAINREPVVEEDWPYDDDMSYREVPVPGGCVMVGTPRRYRR